MRLAKEPHQPLTAMTAHPAQLLTQLLLGLVSLGILALALYLLYRTNRRRRVVLHPGSGREGRNTAPSGGDPMVLSVPVARAWRRTLVNGIAVCMLVGVFAGKYLVAVFHPSGGEPQDPVPAKVVHVRGASGADLRVAHYGASDGAGATLLFTHGWGADRRDWLYAIRSLPPGRSIVTWDLPGLGESSPPADGAYAMSMLARDLDRVVASLGDRPVILVGHSIGGMLNLEYARQFPQKLGGTVRGLVQANTTYTNPVMTKKNAERSAKLQEPVFEPLLEVVARASPLARALGWFAYQSGLAHLQLASQSFAGAESWEQLDDMARYAYRSSPAVVARGVRAMLEWDATEVLPKIEVPTLIISGDEDTTTLPSASDRMARDIRSAARISVKEAAHLGPVEQHRVYADAIEAFAARLSGTGPAQVAQSGVGSSK
jgi:pimeloyl-ACP methyl ester carboxylesterase